MLRKIINIFRVSDFTKNEDGNIFITMALVAPLLVLAVGVGVDTAEIYRARVNFQNAVDAATLVATKIIAGEGGGAKAQAAARLAGRNVFNANMRNLNPDPGKASIDFVINGAGCAGGAVTGVATLKHRVFFNFFHKGAENEKYPSHVTLNAEADVECANNTIEIALVLDNSNSMAGSKMTALRTAATKMVTKLHAATQGNPASEPLKISIVPFSGTVNVGTNNRNATWLDTQGINPNHHENFDWEKDPAVYKDGRQWRDHKHNEVQTRFSMFDRLGVPWGGCVENRPYPMNTNVEVPVQSNPITLFLPWFAPDEPDYIGGGEMSKKRSTDPADAKAICTTFSSSLDRTCVRWSDDLVNADRHPQDKYYVPRYNDGIEYSDGEYIGDSTPGGSGPWVDDVQISGELGTKYMGNSYLEDDHNFPLTIHDHPLATPNTSFSKTDTNIRGQFERQNWTWKYFADGDTLPKVAYKYWAGYISGPNFGCTIRPITPLTSVESTITDELDVLATSGQTNIPQAVAWGWRTLTSTEPFPDGRAESNVNNKKAMIVMTDGENYDVSAWDNGSIYGAYGFEKNGRRWEGIPTDYLDPVGGGTRLRRAMNWHLLRTCENAKKAGITIFTIAFAIPDGKFVKTLMEECASPSSSGGRQYFDAKSAAQLESYFAEIATRLSNLKLVR